MSAQPQIFASRVVTIGAASAFLSVALGAFGAHGLKDRLSPAMLEVYHTGSTYQMYHALALILVGILAERRARQQPFVVVAWLFGVGTLLFSGSLYVLSITGARFLGAITPFGGLCFLAAWALLAAAVVQRSE